jgi:hypothetical protein
MMHMKQKVGKMVYRVFWCSSLTVAIQDGKDAGQTIPHVHVHVIPRRSGDLPFNDQIYQMIDNGQPVAEEDRKRRSKEEMGAEATLLSEGMLEQQVLDYAEEALRKHFDLFNVDESHGLGHARTVMKHCGNAIYHHSSSFSFPQRLSLLLASLLHDADDRKYFGMEASLALNNAVAIASQALKLVENEVSGEVVLTDMKKMINLVSTSKNKNTKVAPEDEWMLLVRFSDRLEAIGWIGVVRCYQYNQEINMPLFVETTPRVTTEEELAKVAPASRFAKYDGNSDSFVDHFYDKLIHVTRIDSENPYFVEQSKRRKKELLDFLFEFGATGKVDESKIKM